MKKQRCVQKSACCHTAEKKKEEECLMSMRDIAWAYMSDPLSFLLIRIESVHGFERFQVLTLLFGCIFVQVGLQTIC